MEQNNNKSRVEEGFNTDNSEDAEEITSDVIIPMDTGGPGIDPYTKFIHPNMVLTYVSDDACP